MKKNLFLLLNFVIAALFLGLIIHSVDFNLLQSTLLRANIPLVLLAILFYFIAHLLAGLRFKLLLPEFKFMQLFSSHMKAMLASYATPARIGYSLFVFEMRKKGLKSGSAAKALGISLASDFIARGLLSLVAVFILSQAFAGLGIGFLAFSFIFLGLFFYKLDFFSSLLQKIPYYGLRLKEAYESVFKQNISVRQLLLALVISLVGSVARGLQWFFVLNSLGLHAGLAELTVFSALLTALSFIPLSLAGFGLQEGGGILLFTMFLGFTVPQATGAVILIRFTDLITDLAVGGWFFAADRKR